MPPFIVLAAPRSRSAWLARFLTYREWTCEHESIRHMGALEDVRAWLSQERVGTVETGGAAWWRLLHRYAPDARVVVVRRPVEEIIESFARAPLRSPWTLDIGQLRQRLVGVDRKLAQAAYRLPNVVSVTFADLEDEATCARVFTHCLPYEWDRAWWELISGLNVQADLDLLWRHYRAFEGRTERLREAAKAAILADMHRAEGFCPDSVTISEEPFSSYFPGAIEEIRRHSVWIGEGSRLPDHMNFGLMREFADLGCLQVTMARSNGRVVGYLLTTIQPTFIDSRLMAAHHTSIWADPATPGIALRMLRFANDRLRSKGVDEIILRAGTRGDGPRLGALFRRVGSEPAGQLFRLEVPHE